MSELELTEKLNRAIELMMQSPQGASPDSIDPSTAELVSVAAELRDLPHAEFKARLREELEREAQRVNIQRFAKGIGWLRLIWLSQTCIRKSIFSRKSLTLKGKSMVWGRRAASIRNTASVTRC